MRASLYRKQQGKRFAAWEGLNRLREKGFICDPFNKTKSVVFTEEDVRESEWLFRQHFVIPDRAKQLM
ncbi:DUF6429 family protein [Paraburkholderia sediminicola]|uniref:DUF6429 family protein n=1 Tax=Paraburkholderia sediminicola TaxID=458836 RepID=UPI0038B7E826